MLYFIIPLRSKAASKNWKNVITNFNMTLNSCYNQTCGSFKIIVVCHDLPTLGRNYDDRVQFIKVYTPTPQNPEEMMADKAYKMYTGMYHIQQILKKNGGGGYVMPVDADDLVNRNLAQFFDGRDDKTCFTSKFGYIWMTGSKWIYKVKDLYRTCGSCTIVYYEPDELPDKPYEDKDPTDDYIFQISHRYLPLKAKKKNKKFGMIPFPTTIYILGTGENHSVLKGVNISWKRKIEILLRLPRRLTNKIKKDFNINL